MLISCGPPTDIRTVNFDLPETRKKIGVFVSGGIDSAILYYLVMLENNRLGNLHTVIPFSVRRSEGSQLVASAVIKQIHLFLNAPFSRHLTVGDPTLPEKQQVASGMRDAKDAGIDLIYSGIIEQLPQHLIGWEKTLITETDVHRVPFQHLNKSHIIDLTIKLKQEALFYITHSCISAYGRCGNCNGCNERTWGFNELGLTDPGSI